MKKDTIQTFIPAFFAGRSIFITGATGFIGKALIEKLLRSCPDVVEIFLLMRPKKRIGANDRLKQMLNNKLFDKLQTERPSSFDKLIPVTGDAAAVDLGLSPADRQMIIDKVSVIFHVAASVRFDDSLKDAIFNNTRSTRDVCILASNMKNLAVLLHVSSTYTQIDKCVVNEILYPPEIDWRRAIEIAESVDEHTLRILTAKYIGNMPNTYVFTKKLAEQVISDYSESLPCVLLRPSIVISTMEDPVKGWLDNFNGPIGTLIGGGKGILRVFYADPTVVSDFIPVDLIVKLMIITAWHRGLKTISEDKTAHVYNCSSNSLKKLNMMQIQQTGFEIVRQIPIEGIIWSPHTTLTKNRWMYYILMLLLHVLPALCIDSIIKLCGARPMLLKLQRKVYVSNSALSYFLLNEWSFKNSQALNILSNLNAENAKDFGADLMNIDEWHYRLKNLLTKRRYEKPRSSQVTS
ncbi:PREDICTED: fatty acyl-CoA reductase 1-like isoform X2 [Dinoponera quadriceps]|uniref:Fatty acyl-CoA reductase n=1 Tax=Dinoponera quadriceps TaxID=609295 RepID=A0A6P3XKA2_DINQU|nr:PREDICTED: fatty acyl-CoA reductase 1-like isoform X2 [Dinoponera quadriceps]